MTMVETPIEGSGSADTFAPSANQERILLSRAWASRSSAEPPPSVLRMGFHFHGRLDTDALQHALNELARRHPALRTAFLESGVISSKERAQRLDLFARCGVFQPGLYTQFI